MNLKTQLKKACEKAGGNYIKPQTCEVEGGKMSLIGPTQRNPHRPEGVRVDFNERGAAYLQADKIRAYSQNPESEQQNMVLEAGKGETKYMRRANHIRLNAGTKHVDLPEEYRR